MGYMHGTVHQSLHQWSFLAGTEIGARALEVSQAANAGLEESEDM